MWELLLWEPRPRGDGAFAQTQRSISRPIAPRAALPQGSNEAPTGPPQGFNEAQSRPLGKCMWEPLMWELFLWEPRPRGDGAFAQTQRSISSPIAPGAALPQGSNEAPKGPHRAPTRLRADRCVA
jgi:hypothetical protein